MGAGLMVVTEIGRKRSLQMSGIQNNEMIESVSTDRADEPLGVRILPRTSRRREHLLSTQGGDPLADCLAVHPIPVANETAGRIATGERFDDLLGGPGRRRMFGHIEMQHPSTLVLQHHEDEQDSQGDCRHGEEVDVVWPRWL